MDVSGHLKRTFLTGIFAAIPLVATAIAVYYVNEYTKPLAPKIYGKQIPFLGLLISAVAVYILGVIVSTTMAKWCLSRLDNLLERMPILQPLYRAWKQVSLSAGAGMWDKVVLVEVETGQTAAIGFTSGIAVENAPDALCVFIPSAPVPTTGRLYIVPKSRCRLLDIPVEEAFKYLISGGNHLPDGIGKAANDLMQLRA